MRQPPRSFYILPTEALNTWLDTETLQELAQISAQMLLCRPHQSMGVHSPESRGHTKARESISPNPGATAKGGGPCPQLEGPRKRGSPHPQIERPHQSMGVHIPNSRAHQRVKACPGQEAGCRREKGARTHPPTHRRHWRPPSSQLTHITHSPMQAFLYNMVPPPPTHPPTRIHTAAPKVRKQCISVRVWRAMHLELMVLLMIRPNFGCRGSQFESIFNTFWVSHIQQIEPSIWGYGHPCLARRVDIHACLPRYPYTRTHRSYANTFQHNGLLGHLPINACTCRTLIGPTDFFVGAVTNTSIGLFCCGLCIMELWCLCLFLFWSSMTVRVGYKPFSISSQKRLFLALRYSEGC